MRYIATTAATGFRRPDWKVRLARAAFFFVPRANPDHESIYPRVRRWLLELDASGQALREIGLDHDGEPILAAPDDRNLGFWTESPHRFGSNEGDAIDAGHFEDAWRRSTRVAN